MAMIKRTSITRWIYIQARISWTTLLSACTDDQNYFSQSNLMCDYDIWTRQFFYIVKNAIFLIVVVSCLVDILVKHITEIKKNALLYLFKITRKLLFTNNVLKTCNIGKNLLQHCFEYDPLCICVQSQRIGNETKCALK